MNKKDNFFTFIRLITALTVVYQHAVLSGYFSIAYVSVMNWLDKVPIFFFISAYSIMLSMDNKTSTFKKYSFKRFLRLYPELWICIILETLVIAIQYPHLLCDYSFYLWILAQLTIFQFWTPDCLRFYGRGTPNGALWTNVIFIQFYIIVYYLFNRIKKIKLWQDIVVLILCIFVNSSISFLDGKIGDIPYKLLLETILPYLYMFYFGIIFYKYSEYLINICKKYFWLIAILFVFASLYNYLFSFIPHTSNTGSVIHVLVCLSFVFAFAYKFNFIKIKNDYSYGIYIYHMVVMNVFIQHNLIANSYLRLIIIYLITMVLAVISNKLTKRVLKKLKVV